MFSEIRLHVKITKHLLNRSTNLLMEEQDKERYFRNREQDDVEDEEDNINGFFKFFKNINNETAEFVKKNKTPIKYISIIIFNLAIFAYFIVALFYWLKYGNLKWEWCDGFGFLFLVLIIVYFFLFYFHILKRLFGLVSKNLFFQKYLLNPTSRICCRIWRVGVLRRFLYLIVFGGIVVYLVLDTLESLHRLKSLIGFFTLLLLGFVFSKSPSKIKWRTVFWGIVLQFFIGVFTIRLSFGRDVLQCIGDKVAAFLDFTRAGASFVFGDDLVYKLGVFGFASLPVIVFISMIVEMLFYLGTIQWVCKKLGWFLQIILGTTVCESMICVANTFIGMTESPLVIRPYIPQLTKSEIHAIMASGFATVSGTVLKAYICFGAEPAHLITASIMSAPATLSFSKLYYPEDSKSKTTSDNIQTVESQDSSLLAAAARGCSNSISLAFNIAANLIGFVSFMAFLNSTLSWLGALVGLEFITFQWILGKVFIPLSWIMGVPWEECEIVGELIGIKTVVNEFVAYQRLGYYKDLDLLSMRGEVIATYCLCGFSNPSSLGIMIGGLSAMAPDRRDDIIAVAGRAFITGCAVCFMTACIAGVLLTDDAVFISNSNSTC